MPKRSIGFFLGAIMLAFMTFASIAAHADGEEGIVAFPEFSVRKVTNDGGGDETDYLINLGAGYRLASGWYFGMLYASTNSNGVLSVNEWSVGNSVGYYLGPVSLTFTLFLASDRIEKTATTNIHWTGGWGTQWDLAYNFPTGYGFTLGPSLIFRSITFGTEDDHVASPQPSSHAETYIYPFITLGFVF